MVVKLCNVLADYCETKNDKKLQILEDLSTNVRRALLLDLDEDR